MHAIDVANLLGINKVVAPLHPGIASAYGLLVAELKNDYARTSLQTPPDYDTEGMERVYGEMESEGRAWHDQVWRYSWDHFVDHEHGAWFRVLTPEGKKIDNQKSPPGKTDYHTLGVCWDILSKL